MKQKPLESRGCTFFKLYLVLSFSLFYIRTFSGYTRASTFVETLGQDKRICHYHWYAYEVESLKVPTSHSVRNSALQTCVVVFRLQKG